MRYAMANATKKNSTNINNDIRSKLFNYTQTKKKMKNK